MNVSALRQQIKPTHRVHGIIQGKDWAANVIPDYCKLIYNARAPTVQELEELIPRVVACFEAAALATGCKVKVTKSSLYKNVVNAPRLSKQYQSFMKKRYNQEVGEETFFASTGEFYHMLPYVNHIHIAFSGWQTLVMLPLSFLLSTPNMLYH